MPGWLAACVAAGTKLGFGTDLFGELRDRQGDEFVARGRVQAPLEVIRERLAARGEALHDPRYAWVHRRAAECWAAHRASDFAVHVRTEGRSPAAIAAEIAACSRHEAAA